MLVKQAYQVHTIAFQLKSVIQKKAMIKIDSKQYINCDRLLLIIVHSFKMNGHDLGKMHSFS